MDDDPIPINLGGTVDPAHVVGRQQDLAQVLTALGRGHGVALTGERRHGKTAFSALVEREGGAGLDRHQSERRGRSDGR